ncbi:MAG: hypothetical protein HYW23_00815 [Candidatus Aenigmarchaeota archaeon]|nr:hypothetical protein [Candidatus Aenigmarchaeota archaeon]
MGKRFLCAQPVQYKDEKGNTLLDYKDGTVSHDGIDIFLGCGTSILTTKAKKEGAGTPYCCKMPMSMAEPKPLPSSD